MRIAAPSIGFVAALPLFVLALSAQVSPAKPQVLIAGGRDFFQSHSSAELFDPASNRFAKTQSTTRPRWEHTATLMNDGTVLITGGYSQGLPARPDCTAERYDPRKQ